MNGLIRKIKRVYDAFPATGLHLDELLKQLEFVFIGA